VVVAKAPYREGALVEVTIDFAGSPPVPATGKICRLAETESGELLLGIMFTEIRERHRDQIVSQIFREQTRRLRAAAE
jgi:hypothetical protein